MRFVRHLSSPAADAAPVRAAATAIVLACGALAGQAQARLVQADLARVVAAPAPGARVAPGLALTDALTGGPTTFGQALADRPALLLPVDYTCGNVCDPMVAMSAAALDATGLARDAYRLILIGIDPRDDAAAARRMLAETLGSPAPAAPRVLIGSATAVERLSAALGYAAVYDADTDSFAHPAAAYLLTRDGRLARVLSPLALNGRDLRLALTEAGEGRVGGLADRLALLCYGYDAERGVYTPLVRRILAAAGIATLVAIGLLVLGLNRLARRRWN